MLELEGVRAGYGGADVLAGVHLRVSEGQVVALLGRNGAGKTTTLRAISGLIRVRAGSVRLGGERIDRLPPEAIVRRGLAHVPEGRQIFADLTVAENLRMGAYARRGPGVRDQLDWVLELFPVLRHRYGQLAGTLSGGEQQMLAIARGLMARPKVLLVDEPSLGLSPRMVHTVFTVLARLRETRTTLLVVEQNAFRALEIADRAYVLKGGRVELEGSSEMLKTSPEVERLYLGA
ncbi:MAG: ABC transporter ATP-binding protein [Armatimonadota bacterium]|nr:ABC transporter ATP-binding protein [Armatimonadota bacterium]MDR7408034.1 ABC transporter ATP-binding protein [Armatimonadota bacterium]